MNSSVLITDWSSHQRELSAIRQAVFVDEQQVPPELELDALDATAIHALALLDGAPVGTGRLLADGRIGRMAVLKSARGKGIGEALLGALMQAAADQGMKEVQLHAQLHAMGFYEKAGFTAFGAVFDDAGIAHRAMRRAL